jgi:rhodanese-related sulfurtransferase
VRSGKAVDLCRSLGLAHDTHMGGGIGAWMAHGFAVSR